MFLTCAALVVWIRASGSVDKPAASAAGEFVQRNRKAPVLTAEAERAAEPRLIIVDPPRILSEPQQREPESPPRTAAGPRPSRTVRKVFLPPRKRDEFRATAPRLPEEAPQVAALFLPSVTPLVSPVPRSAPPRMGRSISEAPVAFVPPVLFDQSAPVVLPPDLRRMLQSEVTFRVRVAVDEAGRVQRVVPVTTPDRTQQVLIRAYAAAIRKWTFTPARRDGVAIPGETILSFRVSPDIR
jgi:hypothetical protein